MITIEIETTITIMIKIITEIMLAPWMLPVAGRI